MTTLFSELRRRNVFRVGVAYVVAAWLALQVLDLVFENIGAPDWVMKSLMALVAIGFPLALVFAWAFELTPEGLKRETDIDRNSSITGQTGKKLDRLIIVFLVGIVAVMGYQQLSVTEDTVDVAEHVVEADPAAASDDIPKSIAVLPFSDLSESRDQSWFGEGLSEEILNALMRTPDLLVASRTSSFKYKESDKDIREIGTELGVAHVLEGSVRRSGDKIRVTAQLIRASDGFHVWSQNYDREMQDVISIQENLAIEIARALKTSMDPVALASMMQTGTRSIEAYHHYLNGLALDARSVATGNFDYYRESYEAFEKARQADPGFAAAHAHAAQFWDEQLQRVSRQSLGLESDSHEHRRNFEIRLRAAIDHAPDPVTRSDYEGRLALSHLEMQKAIESMRIAVENRPNDEEAWDVLLRAAAFAQDRESLLDIRDRTLALANVNPEIAALASMASFILQSPDAGDVARTVLSYHPFHREVVYQSHRALLTVGDVDDASRLIPLMKDDTWFLTASIRQACAEGDRARAEQLARESEAVTRTGNWHAYMLLGEIDKANEFIRETTKEDDIYVAGNWLLYPQFDPTPFPELVAVLAREGINRGAPAKLKYFCPPGD